MKSQESQLKVLDSLALDPVVLLTEELKNKTIKKQAVEEISIIALVLTPTRIRDQLVPLLIKTFVQQNNEMRVIIIKSFQKLLQFTGNSKYVFAILQFIIDVLCVFGEEEIRKQASTVLDSIMKLIDLKQSKQQLKKVIEQLSQQNEKNIIELVLKLIKYMFISEDEEDQLFYLTIFKKYQETEQNQILLAQELPQFLKIAPLFPEKEAHQVISFLINSNNSKAKCKLIDSILFLANNASKDITKQYILTLLKDQNSDVIASLILQIKSIVSVFPEEVTSQLWKIVDSFQSRDLTVKTAIIQVLEDIPLTEQRKQFIINSHNSNKSLNLSKTLANSLCKIHDIQALTKIIDNSDTQFKNKLFPKLPPTCELHIKLMENLFTQKNWRNKLSLLQNLEKRLELNENVELLLPKLLEQLGDKIAVFRMSVIKLIAAIMKTKKVNLKDVDQQLDASLNSKNWFERQAAFLLLQERIKQFSKLPRLDQQFVVKAVKQGANQKISNIKDIALKIAKSCNLKID